MLWSLYQGGASEEWHTTGIWRGYRDVVSVGPVGSNRQVAIKSQRYKPRFFLRYRRFSFLDIGPFVFSKQGLYAYGLGGFRVEIRIRTSGFECLNVYLVWHHIRARDKMAGKLDGICVVCFVFLVMFRVCFDDGTEGIT